MPKIFGLTIQRDPAPSGKRRSADRTLFRQKLIAEFTGTLLLVFFGTSAATAVGAMLPASAAILGWLLIAPAFGLVLFTLIGWFSDTSGANFNPAITLAMGLLKQLTRGEVFGYWIAQLAGGIVASFLTHLIFRVLPGADASGYGVTQPVATGFGALLSAGAVETIGTALLVGTVIATAVNERGSVAPQTAIAVALGLPILVFGPISGGAFNPARAIGPMFTDGKLDGTTFVYLIAEVLGAIIGWAVAVRFAPKQEQSANAGQPKAPEVPQSITAVPLPVMHGHEQLDDISGAVRQMGDGSYAVVLTDAPVSQELARHVDR